MNTQPSPCNTEFAVYAAIALCRVFGGSSSFSIIESMQRVVVDIRMYLLYLLMMMWGFACAYCVLFRRDQEHEVRAFQAYISCCCKMGWGPGATCGAHCCSIAHLVAAVCCALPCACQGQRAVIQQRAPRHADHVAMHALPAGCLLCCHSSSNSATWGTAGSPCSRMPWAVWTWI